MKCCKGRADLESRLLCASSVTASPGETGGMSSSQVQSYSSLKSQNELPFSILSQSHYLGLLCADPISCWSTLALVSQAQPLP